MRTLRTTTALVTIGLMAGSALAQETGPIVIGASLPLTGGFSVSGTKHLDGYELCVELINERGGILGRQVELISSDNRSDTETAISQYERFINVDDVDVLFGTFSSRLSFPVSSIIERYGMIHPVPSGGALRIWSQGHEGIFYFQQNISEETGESIRDMIVDLVPEDQRPQTVAIVHSDDFFANAIAAGFLGQTVEDPGMGVLADYAPGYLSELGMEVVYEEVWPEEGFSDWLNLANSIKRSDAEMIIGLTASAEEAVQLTRALQTVQAEAQMIYLSQGAQVEFQEGLGAASEGVIMHTTWHPDVPYESVLNDQPFSNADFVAAFEERRGRMPDEDSAIPFAVCQGIEQAIIGAGTTDNAALREWLHARTPEDPVRTVLGNFAWDERGLPIGRTYLMAQWQGGELKFIYPTDEFEGVSSMIYPKPAW
jgi:branched-chain amino acid transport system substrate-binding protein